MDERRFFSAQAVQSLLKGPLRDRLPPRVRARLAEEGLDLGADQEVQLSSEQWKHVVDVAAHELHPNLPRAEGHQRIAELVVTAYGETLLGRAFVAIARMLGPAQLAGRVKQQLAKKRSRHVRLVELSASHWELWLHEPAISAAFTERLLARALEKAGAEEVDVHRLRRHEPGCTFRIEWAA